MSSTVLLAFLFFVLNCEENADFPDTNTAGEQTVRAAAHCSTFTPSLMQTDLL